MVFARRAYVLRVDRNWDLAALAIRRPNVQPITLASKAPRPGDSLTIIGYGSGSYRAVTGHCTQYVSPSENLPMEMVELSAPARNGDSGGPILNSRGELAGVLFGTGFGRTAGSYCGRLRRFLTSVEGDFRNLSNRVMLADQSHRADLPTAVSTGPATVSTSAPPAYVATAPLSSVPSRSTLPASPMVSRTGAAVGGNSSADSTGACSVPGPVAAIPHVGPVSTGDQLKTILAIVGVVAVLYHAIRFLGTAVG